MDLCDLTRLIDIDASLASDEGLVYADAAVKHGVTTKTIQRLTAIIRATGRITFVRRNPDDGKYAHHYAAHVMRLFCGDDNRPGHARGNRRRIDHSEVVRLASQEMSVREIAAEFNTTMPVIYRILKSAGMKSPLPSPRTVYDENQAKAMARKGATSPQIAEALDCSMATVWRLCGVEMKAARARRKASGGEHL